MVDFKKSVPNFQIPNRQIIAILRKVQTEKRIFSEYSSEFLGLPTPLFLSLFGVYLN
ncbi:hypothetical protein Aconfl_35270 [Algoriphagus confluentis]|uniref:Uncharacterized protein n=1 Tax=Algoriphagus confluentis TaxID=1697556 RepID=A0ABQ6PSB4_9BACT|nr:hypothetical protein Aconfl_35270 [Algoriphagus confluentis]